MRKPGIPSPALSLDKMGWRCSDELMMTLEPSVAVTRAPGVVYTKPWLVDLVLDVAGYVPEKPLGEMVALEPSAGDGAFLSAMICRLVESWQLHGTSLEKVASAIQAFEISSEAAAKAVHVAGETLISKGVSPTIAWDLAAGWIQNDDFLEASLCFPVADFVIGNPPYIRLEEIPEKKAAMYRSGFSTMRGRADIYVAFYQAALMQLRAGGVCAYICADRWMLNDYGSALRDFITTGGYNVRHIIEAHDVQAFESEVSAYPAVTIIAREPQGPVVVSKALPGIESGNRAILVDSLRRGRTSAPGIRSACFDDWFHGNEPWPCSSPEALRLLRHLDATCFPLESVTTATGIGIGVATGADKVFISKGRPEIEPDRILPLAMASDLQAGRVEWSGHYLANPWDNSGLIDLKAYPRFESHFLPHRDLLSKRHTAQKDRPGNWHKTIDRVNLALVGKRKLYIADIKDRLLPALDAGETYPQHNLEMITSETWDLKVLGALLMSDIGQFFIRCYGVRMRGGYLSFQAQYLRRIRVPEPTSIPADVAATLREAFERQDFRLASQAALQAYGLDMVPEVADVLTENQL